MFYVDVFTRACSGGQTPPLRFITPITKKNVRASLVGAPENIHPLTVGAGSACPEHTHKNKNE